MIYAEKLIAAAGIVSFLLFMAATVTGFKRFRLFKYHQKVGYLCLLFVAIHFVLAASVNFYEITGVISGFFMFLTILSGFILKGRFNVHLILTVCTIMLSLAHVILNLYFG
jgi:hypothetical protein